MSKKVFLALTLLFTSMVMVFFLSSYTMASASGPYFLRPPFEIRQPPFQGDDYPYPLDYYFDHNHPDYNQDGEITIYNGESTSNNYPYGYHGHSGYDWPLEWGDKVLAAAGGTVEICQDDPNASLYGNYIVIDHDNGYQTLYAHLRDPSPCNVIQGEGVDSGDLIGWSGNTGSSTGAHLHFGVYIGDFVDGYEGNVTDPYGWSGEGPDPLQNYGIGHTATCLWRSYHSDPISCYDSIAEDASTNFALGVGSVWLESHIGNGNHMYFHATTDYDLWADWYFPLDTSGIYEVYSWIPFENATTLNAIYWIWTGSSWEYVVLPQQNYNNEWVHLGTFRLQAGLAGVTTNTNTSEGSGARWVAADAIKIRIAPIFLSLIMR